MNGPFILFRKHIPSRYNRFPYDESMRWASTVGQARKETLSMDSFFVFMCVVGFFLSKSNVHERD